MSAPELMPLGSRHMYGFVIPEELELFESVHPSLVFRIEDQSQPGEYVYQWMVDVIFDLPTVTIVDYILDLSSYIGQTVNVSYAFATNTGFSEYSESVEMRVGLSGLVSPSDSGHLLVTESEDEAVKTAYCHVACINYIKEDSSESQTGTNVRIIISFVFYISFNCFYVYIFRLVIIWPLISPQEWRFVLLSTTSSIVAIVFLPKFTGCHIT